MSNTGHFRGINVSFRMHDVTGASFGLTGHGNQFDLTHSGQLDDSTTFGDNTLTNFNVINDYSATFSGYWAGSGADSAASKLAALVSSSAGTWFQANPGGSLKADILNYSGCVHIESLEMGHPAVGLQTWSISLRPRSGSLTFATAVW